MKKIPQTIVITNQKGGVGKTSITVNLAGCLSKNHSVLLIDLDPQGNLTKSFKTANTKTSTFDIFQGNRISVLETENPSIKLIPSSKNLSSLVSQMANDFDLLYKLRDFIKTLKNYDYILIDTPPTLMNLTLSGILASDYILLPISTNYYSLQGTNDMLDAILKIKSKLHSKLQFLGACISIHDKRTAVAHDVLREIKKFFKDNLFKSIIHKAIRVEEAQIKQRPVCEIFPTSITCKEYTSLANELVERMQR